MLRQFKITAAVIAAIILVFAFGLISVNAEVIDSGECGNGLTWTLDDEATLTISGTGSLTELYFSEDLVRKVIIEEGVTSIGDNVFENWSELTSIELPDTLTSIGNSAFLYCGKLTEIRFPDSLTSIGYTAFWGCDFTSIELPGSLTSIGYYAFAECNKVTSITVPGSVTSLGEGAFAQCDELTTVTIGNGVTYLGKSMFGSCLDLTNVNLPGSLMTIEEKAFNGCSGLEGIELPYGLTSIGDEAFSECGSLKNIELPESVTYIGSKAFYNCKSLTGITIPASVTDLGPDNPFERCAVMKNISVDEGNECFCSVDGVLYSKDFSKLIAYPTGLNSGSFNISYVVHDGVKSIGNRAFNHNNSLSAITLPDGLTSIGDYAFDFCEYLRNIDLPDSVNSIGKGAFCSCEDIRSIVIPEGVTTIEDSTFEYCNMLEDVRIPESVTSIGGSAFYRCHHLERIEIPDSVTNIGASAFVMCDALANIILPENLTNISNYLFSYCSSLTSVIIPGSVTDIGEGAFYQCSGLTSITIPVSVTNILSHAFKHCDSLTDVYYEGSESGWKAISIGNDNESLTNASIHYKSGGSTEPDDPETVTVSGVLREENDWKITWEIDYFDQTDKQAKLTIKAEGQESGYTGGHYMYSMIDDGSGGLTMPWLTNEYGFAKTDFTSIEIEGREDNKLIPVIDQFRDYTNVKEVKLEFVERLDTGAFRNCTSLATISADKTLAFIDNYALANTAVTSFDFSNIKTIGISAFRGTPLGSVRIKRNVTSIGKDAFADCKDITIYCYKNSTAHTYAVSENIPFKLIKDDPDSDKDSILYYVRKTGSTEYSPELAYNLMLAADKAYAEKDEVAAYLDSVGVDHIKTFNYYVDPFDERYGKDSVAYSIGYNDVGNDRYVTIVIRGSYGQFDTKKMTPDWKSNFNIGEFKEAIGTNGWHNGFDTASQEVYNKLDELGLLSTEKTKYVITGHSRGGGVGNLLAVRLHKKGISKDNVYDYNFACPDTARQWPSDWNYNGEHDNMFNIGCVGDIVSVIPGLVMDVNPGALTGLAWGKYGKSVWFAHDWATAGSISWGFDAHEQSYYINAMKSKKPFSEYKSFNEMSIKQVKSFLSGIRSLFQCPVDVKAIDAKGNTIASVVDGELYYSSLNKGKVLVFTDGETKLFYALDGQDIHYEIVGNDDGTMTYTTYREDLVNGSEEPLALFENVAISENKRFVAQAAGDNTLLLTVDDSGTVTGEVDTDGSEIPADLSKAVVKVRDCTYNGKQQKPAVHVTIGGAEVDPSDYTITYGTNINAGKGTVTIAGTGNCKGEIAAGFKINQAKNTLSVKGKTASVKYSKVRKKAQILSATKIITGSKTGKGTMSYKLLSAKKGKKSFKKYFTISSKTGKLTIKKGLKKGTYTLKVKVRAAGNNNYKASATKTVTIKIKVK